MANEYRRTRDGQTVERDPKRAAPTAGTEIAIKFRDYVIPYPACQTGTVAIARLAGWLMRFPYAHVDERYQGPLCTILVEIDENVPAELRREGAF